MPVDIHCRLPRLPEDAYLGCKHMHLVAATEKRRRVFVTRKVVDPCVEMLRDTCAQFDCEGVVYVFMPDHVHMVLHELSNSSNGLHCHNHWKGESGSVLAQMLHGGTIWQERSFDHVFRSKEYERHALAKTLSYILENSVRAGLADHWSEYPYLGSLIGSYDIRHPYWWTWFHDES